MDTLLRRFAVSLYAAPPDMGVADFAALLAERGIGGIGLTPPALLGHAPEALKAILDRHGLRASSLNSAGYVLHADPALAAEQRALDAALVAAARVLDAPVNLIPGGLLQAGPGPHDPAALRDAARRGIAAMAAAAPDVAFSLEPMHPMALGARGCLNQVSSARTAIAGLDSVGLTLDLFHSHWDAELLPLLRDAPGLLRVVQVCGVTLSPEGGAAGRAALREGAIDVGAFLRALDAAGYAGMIEYEVFFEPMGRPDPAAMLDQAVADYRALMGETA